MSEPTTRRRPPTRRPRRTRRGCSRPSSGRQPSWGRGASWSLVRNHPQGGLAGALRGQLTGSAKARPAEAQPSPSDRWKDPLFLARQARFHLPWLCVLLRPTQLRDSGKSSLSSSPPPQYSSSPPRGRCHLPWLCLLLAPSVPSSPPPQWSPAGCAYGSAPRRFGTFSGGLRPHLVLEREVLAAGDLSVRGWRPPPQADISALRGFRSSVILPCERVRHPWDGLQRGCRRSPCGPALVRVGLFAPPQSGKPPTTAPVEPAQRPHRLQWYGRPFSSTLHIVKQVVHDSESLLTRDWRYLRAPVSRPRIVQKEDVNDSVRSP